VTGYKQTKLLDFIGLFLFCCVGVMSIVPYFMSTALMVLHWDHNPFILHLILPPSISHNPSNPIHFLFFWILRPFTTFICMFEAMRILSFMFNCFVFGTQMFLHSLHLLDASCRRNIAFLERTYKTLIILRNRFYPTQSEATLFIMFIGMMTFVLSLQVLILINDLVPLLILAFFSATATIIPVLVEVTLPYFILCHEESKIYKHKWTTRTTFWNCRKRLSRKILRAFQPLSFHVGIFQSRLFVMKQSTKTMYYKTMTDYTISLMLYLAVAFGCSVTTGTCSNWQGIAFTL